MGETDEHGGAQLWSRERIQAFLDTEDLRYQNVELPFGLSTGGTDRSGTAAMLFPDDLTGRSVLDIGSKFGFFCFEAIKRGAKRVVGVDVDPESIRKARALAEMLGHDVEFHLFDIERDRLDEHFDLIICLNLLHHLKDPIQSLDRMTDLANDQLLLEVAGVGRHERKKLGLSWFRQQMLRNLPVMVVANNRMNIQSNQNFFFTASALENVLTNRSHRFARVTQLPTGHKGRYILRAEKRRIRKLVIVAGPTSSGKSTFIDTLLDGNVGPVLTDAGIHDPSLVQRVDASKVHRFDEPVVDTLLLHYDMLRPMHASDKSYDRDPALQLIDLAEEVRAYTLWTPPDRLRQQLHQGELSRLKVRKRHLRVRMMYEQDDKIMAAYERWLGFLDEKKIQQRIVSYTDGHSSFLDRLPRRS